MFLVVEGDRNGLFYSCRLGPREGVNKPSTVGRARGKLDDDVIVDAMASKDRGTSS